MNKIQSADQSNAQAMATLPVRLLLFVILTLIAIGAIWLIDQRAMQPQVELEQDNATPALSP